MLQLYYRALENNEVCAYILTNVGTQKRVTLYGSVQSNMFGIILFSYLCMVTCSFMCM